MGVSALIILIFFVPYTASGFSACGKLFSSLFGWDYHIAMIVSAIIIISYTCTGGFLAASTTDLIQSIVMTTALAILVIFGVSTAGGIDAVMDNARGLTNYLSGQIDSYKSLIVPHPLGEQKDEDNDSEPHTLDVLPMGKIPPNPTELLYSPKLKPMLDELRQHYDYIFVDCPPVEIVADASIISHESDLTIFVIRTGLLDRSMLPELQKNYDEKRYNNMTIILNGTDADHHHGYHRYGYGYGRYGYGKQYGYGYYGSNEKS
jgi:capsular exopolysaccharide synthesis family protein